MWGVKSVGPGMCPAEAAGHILVLNPALVRGVKDHRAGESPLSRPFRALSISCRLLKVLFKCFEITILMVIFVNELK